MLRVIGPKMRLEQGRFYGKDQALLCGYDVISKAIYEVDGTSNEYNLIFIYIWQ